MASDEERLEELLKSMTESENNNTGMSGIDALKLAKETEEERMRAEMETPEEAVPEMDFDALLPEEEPAAEAELPEMAEEESDFDALLPKEEPAPEAELSEMAEEEPDFDALLPEEEPEMDFDALLPEEEAASEEELNFDEFLPEEESASEPEPDIDIEETQMEGNEIEESPSYDNGEIAIDPLEFMDMSEEEVDKILSGEHAMPEESGSGGQASEDEMMALEESDDLSDIQDLLNMSDNHEMVSEDTEPSGNDFDIFIDPALEGIISPEEVAAAVKDEAGEGEAENGKRKKKKRVKKKKERKKKSKNADSSIGNPLEDGEEKEGFWKKIALALFGSADDELSDNEPRENLSDENMAVMDELAEEDAAKKKAEAKGKKGKKPKKDKKDKKKEEKKPDPKQLEKERKKKEKKAAAAQKKAEKAEKAAEEKKNSKKLPKKRVISVVFLCATILAAVLLINNVGMPAFALSEARNAYAEGDYQTVYELFAGKSLHEEDQEKYEKAEVVLRMRHAAEAYENHKKMGKVLLGLDDLMRGVEGYQKLLNSGDAVLITADAENAYNEVLQILQSDFSISEADAIEIISLEDDYLYSLQLEALARGEAYQGAAGETEEVQEEPSAEQQEEPQEDAAELEDVLPEEEDYINGSSD